MNRRWMCGCRRGFYLSATLPVITNAVRDLSTRSRNRESGAAGAESATVPIEKGAPQTVAPKHLVCIEISRELVMTNV